MSVQGPPFWHPYTGAFVRQLTAAASGLEVSATSWYRSPERNAQVGGSPWSQHLVGWGLDVVGPGANQFAKAVRARGMIAVVEADHVHVQLFPAGVLRGLSKTV